MSKLEDQLKQISATAGPVESDDEDLGAAEDSSAELDDEQALQRSPRSVPQPLAAQRCSQR